jgi:hypothetical protein
VRARIWQITLQCMGGVTGTSLLLGRAAGDRFLCGGKIDDVQGSGLFLCALSMLVCCAMCSSPHGPQGPPAKRWVQ